MSNSPAPYTFRDLAFIPVRALVLLPFLPFALLAGLFKLIGQWGDWLEDAGQDILRAATIHLNPRAWDLFKQYKEERDAFERGEAFWKAEAKRLQAEADETNNPTTL